MYNVRPIHPNGGRLPEERPHPVEWDPWRSKENNTESIEIESKKDEIALMLSWYDSEEDASSDRPHRRTIWR